MREAFVMYLKKGHYFLKEKRAYEIWPELAEALSAAGISDYSIFLDEESLTLFAVQKLSETNTAAQLPQTAIMQKWWAYMAPLMEVN
ncbi:MAG TPA: L-rhamnose mutarotase, partial [Sphaerochaeta sp.]|nr:L-rhamnose mutarotase [Sphaerochaeta sp.]